MKRLPASKNLPANPTYPIMLRSLVSPGVLLATLSSLVLGSPRPATAGEPFVFKSVGEAAGVLPALSGLRAHGAAWGDANGDGSPDLFVATFHDAGSKPSQFVWNEKGKFRLDEAENLHTSGMGSGALFVDLSNNGRLDLYVSNCATGKEGPRAAPSQLFRNDGGGKFTDVSDASGACPTGYAGRGVAALDYDGDGLIDLITCERYYGEVSIGPALYKNLGHYRFKNVAAEAGLPAKYSGLSVAAADVNGDTWPDLFLSGGSGDHRLFLNDGHGKFREAPGSAETFLWTSLPKGDGSPAGVCVADVNRDGLADVVITQHFENPWRHPASPRLYLQRETKSGGPKFEEVTEAAGITPIGMKAPHVEIQDFDNDGWPDIYTSVVKYKEGETHPVIYRNLGMKGGEVRFEERAWAVNDFPSAEDLSVKGTAAFFNKLVQTKKVIYMAAAPSCDYDRDGRVDLFLANWWVEDDSLLLHNETPGGNYLDVTVTGPAGVNRQGIGSLVRVYPAGKLGDAKSLLGAVEIRSGYGFCSGQEAVAHFGLGAAEAVDFEVILPNGRGTFTEKNVKANQRYEAKPTAAKK